MTTTRTNSHLAQRRINKLIERRSSKQLKKNRVPPYLIERLLQKIANGKEELLCLPLNVARYKQEDSGKKILLSNVAETMDSSSNSSKTESTAAIIGHLLPEDRLLAGITPILKDHFLKVRDFCDNRMFQIVDRIVTANRPKFPYHVNKAHYKVEHADNKKQAMRMKNNLASRKFRNKQKMNQIIFDNLEDFSAIDSAFFTLSIIIDKEYITLLESMLICQPGGEKIAYDLRKKCGLATPENSK